MNNQNNQRRQSILLAAMATIFLFSAFGSAFAQDAPKFKVGDRVECDYIGTHEYWKKATVAAFRDNDMYNGYTPDQGYYYRVIFDGSDEAIPCKAADMRPLAVAKPAAKQNADDNQAVNNAKPDDDNQNQQTENREFKVGDRVKVHIFDGEEQFHSCTITRGLIANGYRVRCDPQGRISFMDYGVLPEWVFPWADAAAAPTLECSFDAPAGTVSNSAAPSAQLFKRVIYERMADDVKTQYGANVRFGLQFTTFQLGTPFKNVMTGKGLLRDSVPQNAMFYPVKTQYKECREVPNGDYNRYRVTRMNFGCYKDSFGDWVCGTDSTPEFLEQQDVPKKQ